MKRMHAGGAGVVLALAFAGCPATNSPDDAGPGDAPGLTDVPAVPDAPPVDAGGDAFACPDRDGDGDRDFACGGGDCAD
ncbi:MAG: hypothetical protein K1X94_17405, partial [Sandaracinaceae bacterium]|nr:hypothetical protein [Sandaracinaceae bacterium]